MTRKVLVPIADGTEEIEAVTIIDILRRAEADVTVASVDDIQISASRGVKITADQLIADCADQAYDLIVIPGGMPGAEHLRDSDTLTELLVLSCGPGTDVRGDMRRPSRCTPTPRAAGWSPCDLLPYFRAPAGKQGVRRAACCRRRRLCHKPGTRYGHGIRDQVGRATLLHSESGANRSARAPRLVERQS